MTRTKWRMRLGCCAVTAIGQAADKRDDVRRFVYGLRRDRGDMPGRRTQRSVQPEVLEPGRGKFRISPVVRHAPPMG
jgi:hypothetical protein